MRCLNQQVFWVTELYKEVESKVSKTRWVARLWPAWLIVLFASGWLYGCAPTFSPDVPADISQVGTWHQASLQTSSGLREVHFVEAGTPGKPLVVFIHGTPGSWRGFLSYLASPTLQSQTHMLALDRPGFGRSQVAGPLPNFADQAKAVGILLERNQSGKPALVVGHSLGGSIGYRVAIDFPNEVGALLALSSAVDPSLSKPRWYNHIARIPGIHFLVPKDLATANKEMMPLVDHLKEMRSALAHLSVPITIVQGGKDPLVDTGNVTFAQQLMTKADLKVVDYPEHGHFIVWEEPQDIIQEVLALVAKL